MRSLTLLREYRETAPRLEAHIRRIGERLRILEAGCGYQWPLELAGLEFELTGVDMDAAALQKRRDLKTALVGDLRNAALLPSGTFDVIYSSFVLEHVDGAERVLENFHSWLRPGGLMIIRVPDRDSVYGLVTRLTPFWLHVWYKRWIAGMPNAGKPGFDPYPTHYDPVIARDGIAEFCARHGCRILDEHGTGFYLDGRFGMLSRIAAIVISALSLGRLAWRHNNLTFVIARDAAPKTLTEAVSVAQHHPISADVTAAVAGAGSGSCAA
jgi:SAM-dependent methyltransferase